MSSNVSPMKNLHQPDSEEVKLPSAYETLMKQHREAILRIHTLETENLNLMNLLKQTLSGNVSSFVNQAANPAELLARVQALEGRNETPSAQRDMAPDQAPQTDNVGVGRVPNPEMEQLRVQNQTLVSQVSKLDVQLQEMRVERTRRRRRRSAQERKTKTGFLGRLFGR